MFFKNITTLHEESDFKIVKTTIKNLVNSYKIENYYRNRQPDKVRVDFLENLFKTSNCSIVPQIISTWYHCEKLYIYDGIHRLSAAINLMNFKNMKIIVKIFETPDESKIIRDFKEINSAICIPWLYLEENNQTKKLVCESIVNKMIDKFKACVSPSRYCQRQNFNRDNMIELISGLNIDFYKQNIDVSIFNMLLNLNLLARDYIIENNIKTPKKCDYYGFWLMYLPREEITFRLENNVLINF